MPNPNVITLTWPARLDRKQPHFSFGKAIPNSGNTEPPTPKPARESPRKNPRATGRGSRMPTRVFDQH